MVIYFITGNENKFKEAKAIIPEFEQLNIDIDEIQELDPKKIIEHKINLALKKCSGKILVEDTSLFIECLNGFPGPLIKWFLKSMAAEEIYNLVKKYSNNNTTALTHIGYYDGEKINFFSAELKGKIVQPKGKTDFGWDCIFKPENSEKTLGEIPLEEKNKISMRYKVFTKLKTFLENVKTR